jgi:hypothetical protein
MAIFIRRRPTKKQRAASAASKAGSTVWTFMKARIAWAAGKKVAVPAAAVGTAAVVAKKRSAGHHEPAAPSTSGVNAVPPTAAGVA